METYGTGHSWFNLPAILPANLRPTTERERALQLETWHYFCRLYLDAYPRKTLGIVFGFLLAALRFAGCAESDNALTEAPAPSCDGGRRHG